MRKILFLLYLSAIFIVFCPYASQASGNALAIQSGKDAEIVTISLPLKGSVKTFTLDNPPRLVVDVPNFPGERALRLPENYSGLVKTVRTGQFNPHTVRIVFELARPATSINQHITGQAVTIEIKAGGAAPVKQAAANAKGADAEEPAEPQHKNTRTHSPKDKKEKKGKKPAPAKVAAITKPMVVIDAGHGGQDPGAQGPDGSHEKDITLEYARALRKALLATGRYRVTLTRDGDYFILLRQRTAIARKAGGDLFISLHADSAPGEDTRGLSIYTLSETASDDEAEALAAKENRADVLSGMDLSHESEDVAGILISLAQRETNNTSAMFADLLVKGLKGRNVHLLPHSHRFAGFAVLKAPDMPSALVETGFISHPEEERLLKSHLYREQLIKGLVDGVDIFFQKKHNGNI